MYFAKLSFEITHGRCDIFQTVTNQAIKNFYYVYRVVKRNWQVVKLLGFEQLNENMVQNSSPACKHNIFALIKSKKMFVKCLGI